MMQEKSYYVAPNLNLNSTKKEATYLKAPKNSRISSVNSRARKKRALKERKPHYAQTLALSPSQ